MDVEYSSIQQNATDNDNRERCEKRKRIHDSSEPNEREVKKFCSDVQSMVISETPIVNPSNSSPDGFPVPNFPGNLFQTTNNSPSFSSNNITLSSNYATNLPSHFYNSGNYSSNNYSSTNNVPTNNFQTKAESLTIDSSMYMSSIIIFIRTLTGRMLEIEANPQDTVLGLKERIQMRDGIPPSNQRLVFQGKALSDSQILHSYVSLRLNYFFLIFHYFFLKFISLCDFILDLLFLLFSKSGNQALFCFSLVFLFFILIAATLLFFPIL